MRYLQISLQLRLRGLQLDERPRGLGDHFLQQVIIWAKSRACQAGSARWLCRSLRPRLRPPRQAWHLCATEKRAACSPGAP